MNRFHFPLEGLLRLRRTLVRQEERVLSLLLARRARLANSLAETLERIRTSSEEAQNIGLKGTHGAELAISTAELRNYAVYAAGIRADLRRLAAAIEQQAARYRAAQCEQEKVEKLREQAQAEWLRERARREQQAVDELFLMRRRRGAATP